MPPTPRLDTPIASPTGGTTAPTAMATEISPSRRHSPTGISQAAADPLRSSAITNSFRGRTGEVRPALLPDGRHALVHVRSGEPEELQSQRRVEQRPSLPQ